MFVYERSNTEADGSLLQKLLLPFRAVYSFKTKREVRALIRRHQIQLVHVHNTLLVTSPSVFAACFATEILWWRIGLLGAALVLLAAGIAVAVKLERDAGYYECPHCHTRYVPTLKAVVFAPHLGRSRKMKCPYCGNKGYHKKVLEP